ncbi:MAG: dTDP-4-dehydrorhamnose reductase [Gammaproteobacteria bacterium]|nr:dTDP-4-dehydrorhamnose reductase [Gammaproteobacteria bacterium]
MRVLITGGEGQLATALRAAVPEGWVVNIAGRRELDVALASSARAVFEAFEPQLVINTAAYTAVDKAEEEPDKAFTVNTDGARIVAELCVESSARMIQLSTDFVFDGRKSSPYLPGDAPHPLGVYGSSKREAERLVLETLGERAAVVRTSWLYGAGGKNFVMAMLSRMQAGQPLDVVADQIGTPTWTRTLADALWRIGRRPDVEGIWHFSDAGVASWYDFTCAIQEEAISAGLVENPVVVKPIRSEDYKSMARRPYYSVLDKTRTWGELDIVPVHWRMGLRGMLMELKNG